jgi:hypothetical protein
LGVIVGPSCDRLCGAAGSVTATSMTASARAGTIRGLGCDFIDFGIMGARVLNAFDQRSNYSFGF